MIFRVFVRKILGRKGTFFLRNVLSHIFIKSGFVEPANKVSKANGISAMVLTCNDPDWIEPALLSIKDLVDEYVVIDSSTDETPEIIMGVKEMYGLNLRMYRTPPGDVVKARNLGLRKANYKWILIWDSDFIAKPEIAREIKKLIYGLDSKYYYLVYWPMIKLCGDLFHLCREIFHVEHWLYTWSPKLKYRRLGMHDSLIAPLTMYKAVTINKPLGYHLVTVRNPVKIAIKRLTWKQRDAEELLKQGLSIEEVAKKKARKLYNTDDLEELGRMFIAESISNLPCYDKEIFGDYPYILKKYVKERYGINL